MSQRTVEVMATFILKIEDDRFVQALLDELQEKLDEIGHDWFVNRVSQKDGRKTTLRFDYKRPAGV